MVTMHLGPRKSLEARKRPRLAPGPRMMPMKKRKTNTRSAAATAQSKRLRYSTTRLARGARCCTRPCHTYTRSAPSISIPSDGDSLARVVLPITRKVFPFLLRGPLRPARAHAVQAYSFISASAACEQARRLRRASLRAQEQPVFLVLRVHPCVCRGQTVSAQDRVVRSQLGHLSRGKSALLACASRAAQMPTIPRPAHWTADRFKRHALRTRPASNNRRSGLPSFLPVREPLQNHRARAFQNYLCDPPLLGREPFVEFI